MPIERNRDVFGRDLDALRERVGASPRDMSLAMNISLNLYYDLVKQKDSPIDRRAVALMVRWYANHPNEFPIRRLPSLDQIQKRLIELGIVIDNRNLVQLFGRTQAAVYRFSPQGGKAEIKQASGNAQAAIELFYKIINEHGRNGFLEWVENARAGSEYKDIPFELVAPGANAPKPRKLRQYAPRKRKKA